MLERAIDEHLDLVAVEWLLDVVVRAELHRFDRGLHGGKRGHQHHRHFRLELLDLGQQFDPRHLRHLQIRDDQINLRARQASQRDRALIGRDDFVPFASQNGGERVSHHVLVVDD